MTEREQFLERRVAELERQLQVERAIKVGQHKKVIHRVRQSPSWGRRQPDMPPIDRFITALVAHGFSWRPGASDRDYLAQCPAHGSESHKLSITVKPDRLLLKCFSHDCSALAVVKAIGLRASALFGSEFDGVSTLDPSRLNHPGQGSLEARAA